VRLKPAPALAGDAVADGVADGPTTTACRAGAVGDGRLAGPAFPPPDSSSHQPDATTAVMAARPIAPTMSLFFRARGPAPSGAALPMSGNTTIIHFPLMINYLK